jgi:hypothetical protein
VTAFLLKVIRDMVEVLGQGEIKGAHSWVHILLKAFGIGYATIQMTMVLLLKNISGCMIHFLLFSTHFIHLKIPF